ncbi:hypothetical protein [Streptomyces sp. NPDC006368]|uniref:hypothetical protein n=1 Tax=Streptomyces sp. NPDC006368 TaxID=3156760 RepID=UPI0033BE43C4
MNLRRILTTLGTVAAAGAIGLGAATSASAATTHTAYLYTNGGTKHGDFRAIEHNDEMILCDVKRGGYVKAVVSWSGSSRFTLTDGDDANNCAYSSASGKGYPVKRNIPEGVTVTVELKSYTSGGSLNGSRTVKFVNDH